MGGRGACTSIHLARYGPWVGIGGVNSVTGLTQQLQNHDGAGQSLGCRWYSGYAGNWLHGESDEDRASEVTRAMGKEEREMNCAKR